MSGIMDKLGEIFYLLPWLLLGGIVAVAIVALVRACHYFGMNTTRGLVIRAALTVVALGVVLAIWYYFTPKALGAKKHSDFFRWAAVVCYIISLIDIWHKSDTEE